MDNQEIKADAGKLAISTVPTEAIEAIAVIRQYGIKKYGSKESWRQVSIPRYREAVLRHILHWWKDPNAIDEESGLPSLWHALCNMSFIIALEKELPVDTRVMISDRITENALDAIHNKLSKNTEECKPTAEDLIARQEKKRYKIIMQEQVLTALDLYARAYNGTPINWHDKYQEKWHIILIHSPKSNGATTITVAASQTVEQPNSVYFTSREIAANAIQSIGETSIKKYLFGKED